MITPDVEEARRKQRDDIRSACGCVAFWVAAFGVLVSIGPLWRWLSAPGQDEIVIADFSQITGCALYLGVFTLLFLGSVMNTRSTTRALLGAAIVLVISGICVHGYIFRKFVALSARGSEVQLSFVFPRPRRVLDAHTISNAEIVRAMNEEGESSVALYRLEITTRDRMWVSHATSHPERLERALALVNKAKAR